MSPDKPISFPYRILAIDPGERTGVSAITVESPERVIVSQALVVVHPEFPKWLLPRNASVYQKVVVEDWINYSGLDSNIVNQVIGNVQLWTLQGNSEMVLRTPQSRELARGVFKFKKPSHDPDHLSATLHGLSYLLTNNLINPRTKLEFSGQADLTNYLKPN